MDALTFVHRSQIIAIVTAIALQSRLWSLQGKCANVVHIHTCESFTCGKLLEEEEDVYMEDKANHFNVEDVDMVGHAFDLKLG